MNETRSIIFSHKANLQTTDDKSEISAKNQSHHFIHI